jgi:hypothetical protein
MSAGNRIKTGFLKPSLSAKLLSLRIPGCIENHADAYGIDSFGGASGNLYTIRSLRVSDCDWPVIPAIHTLRNFFAVIEKCALVPGKDSFQNHYYRGNQIVTTAESFSLDFR